MCATTGEVFHIDQPDEISICTLAVLVKAMTDSAAEIGSCST